MTAVLGHWRRALFIGPGMEDRSTRVHWFQAERGFCDIRIPTTRPDIAGAAALAELSAADLLGLMNGFGFAGETEVSGDRCTWHRQIAFHGTPPGAAPDIGVLRFRADGRLIEDGAEAPYREIWDRQPGEGWRHGAWRSGDRICRLTWSEAEFLLAIGTPGAADSLPLRQSLETGERPTEALAAFFDGEYTLGHWQGGTGIATLSTNPLQEGRAILPKPDDERAALTLVRTGFGGEVRDETWTA
ncbi:hypothetical protein [Thetidibacter halocola]|uniref:Uncharacterized protein n=1 Tax=Thetidibacter halocola TaxID=2827239 RepID=A0A8J8B6Y2_9RHOB|nr:hypothetical protein [Thetidibacter halocola]MBS0124516.1 hypothetical protein [Thetidibacter halocola]